MQVEHVRRVVATRSSRPHSRACADRRCYRKGTPPTGLEQAAEAAPLVPQDALEATQRGLGVCEADQRYRPEGCCPPSAILSRAQMGRISGWPRLWSDQWLRHLSHVRHSRGRPSGRPSSLKEGTRRTIIPAAAGRSSRRVLFEPTRRVLHAKVSVGDTVGPPADFHFEGGGKLAPSSKRAKSRLTPGGPSGTERCRLRSSAHRRATADRVWASFSGS